MEEQIRGAELIIEELGSVQKIARTIQAKVRVKSGAEMGAGGEVDKRGLDMDWTNQGTILNLAAYCSGKHTRSVMSLSRK